jgi:hypothetical protein
MVPLFDHHAIIQCNDFITFWNHRQQTMSKDDGGLSLSQHHLLDVVHDIHFGLIVQQRRQLVAAEEHGSLFENRPHKGHLFAFLVKDDSGVLVGSLGFRGCMGFGGKASTAPAAWSATAWHWLASSSLAATQLSAEAFLSATHGSGLAWDDPWEKPSHACAWRRMRGGGQWKTWWDCHFIEASACQLSLFHGLGRCALKEKEEKCFERHCTRLQGTTNTVTRPKFMPIKFDQNFEFGVFAGGEVCVFGQNKLRAEVLLP